jgi:serine/threonine-protein kinase
MGTVFEAERLSTHEVFAIKFIKDNLAEDESQLVRFEREIGALRAIRHPNVVNVFEWSFGNLAGTRPYVVMELLEGESLQDLLKRQGKLPTPQAVAIMLQTLEGLAAAHEQGVMHRDLGPSNVFLEARARGRFRVKLLDFGLAREVHGEEGMGITQRGMMMGKPAYVAPEQFLTRGTDQRIDIFACGVLLFRMLTGRLPYAADSAEMLWVERWVERQSEKPYPSVAEFALDVPGNIIRVVSTALERNPRRRFSSARAMQADLLAAEGDLGAAAFPHGSGADASGSFAPSSRFETRVEEPSSHTVDGRPVAPAPTPPPRRQTAAIAIAAAGFAVTATLALVFLLSGGSSSPAATPPPGTESAARESPPVPEKTTPAEPDPASTAVATPPAGPPATTDSPGDTAGTAGPENVLPPLPAAAEVEALLAAAEPQVRACAAGAAGTATATVRIEGASGRPTEVAFDAPGQFDAACARTVLEALRFPPFAATEHTVGYPYTLPDAAPTPAGGTPAEAGPGGPTPTASTSSGGRPRPPATDRTPHPPGGRTPTSGGGLSTRVIDEAYPE